MQAPYKIVKEANEFVVVNKAGRIIAYFGARKDLADEYLASQRRADEQSQVLGDFNRAALLRELLAEI